MSIQIITYATLPCIRYETFEITSAIDLCNEEKSISKNGWWASVDSNHGPQSYQDCALTS